MIGAQTILTTQRMRRQRTPEEYRLYKAALEWDLVDPIVIEKRDDFKSEPMWQGRVEPFHHQVSNLITFCRRLPVTLLADDVGLGKTISAGLVISELMARSRVSNVLVVCPKLLGPQWQEELQSKFGIDSKVVAGKDLVDADLNGVGAVITTYQSARLYLDDIPKDRFEMLILDEAHKLRNLYGTAEPPKVAQRFRAALEERRFRYVLMLTATPIHNRLWDLYSLVDLLTVARGHQNPFGSEGEFARKFIGDSRTSARVLKDGSREQFRSIVYGYMSRVRRADAKLHFPERVVQMHKVPPTPAEVRLIQILAKAIKRLNPLAQISLLQAVVSSPDALLAQLINMARKGTVPHEVRDAVAAVVKSMPRSAKLEGLAALISRLKAEDPTRWRLVVFTTRLETQTTIEVFLTGLGLKVGTINGTSGPRNQQTLTRFRCNPPECNVIVSTEAGAEGVNLQAANVLVNFDLPWNPMIVEQRIGRIQRLASNYERVGIYNIVLAGTFEEYIVGRLMQKLQMAASAIGDIESILEAAGLDDDGVGTSSFEEQIRRLVLKALEDRDVERDTVLTEKSIESAKVTLEEYRENLEEMLGGAAEEGKGPVPPSLPETRRSMTSREFAMSALTYLDGRIRAGVDDTYLLDRGKRQERICFEAACATDEEITVYAPGTRAFENLVERLVQVPVHDVSEHDANPRQVAHTGAVDWVKAFGGQVDGIDFQDVDRAFNGSVLVRARATVAHDSYERLVTLPWDDSKPRTASNEGVAVPMQEPINDLVRVGIDSGVIESATVKDEGLAEFCRFYVERREEELSLAGSDARRRKKLEEEFTPRLALSVVGIQGETRQVMNLDVRFHFNDSPVYLSHVLVSGLDGAIVDAPELLRCSISGTMVPGTCLSRCEVTGALALTHLLVRSEASERLGSPDCIVTCAVSHQKVLRDEVDISGVSGRPVLGALLHTSAVSGIRAEPAEFGVCEITGAEVLKSELLNSAFTGKRFRSDEVTHSHFSGKIGHRSEFFRCPQSSKVVAIPEGEQCWATKILVAPGVLKDCEITGHRVLSAEMGICSSTKKNVCRQLLVESSISKLTVLEKLALKGRSGNYCLVAEAGRCRWSGRAAHPDDMGYCAITGLAIDKVYLVEEYGGCLKPIPDLLKGIFRPADVASEGQTIAAMVERSSVGGKIIVESTLLSPNKFSLLASIEVRTLLGLRVHHAVVMIDIKSRSVVGRITLGRRAAGKWLPPS